MTRYYVARTDDWGYGWSTFYDNYKTEEEAKARYEEIKDRYYKVTLGDRVAEIEVEIEALQAKLREIEQ